MKNGLIKLLIELDKTRDSVMSNALLNNQLK